MGRFRLLIAALLAALALVHPVPDRSASAEPARGGQPPSQLATTTITIHGVRLTLELPGMAYPPNALVLASVYLTNLTGRPITTWDCLSASLGTEVVGPEGFGLYPPLLPPPGAPWSQCAGAIARPQLNALHIQPAQTITRMTYIVLRSASVHAWADLRFDLSQSKPTIINTPPIHLIMTSAPGPQLLLSSGPPVSAQVAPAPGAGPILYSEFASCRDAAHARHPIEASAAFSRWLPASQLVLRPFTSPPCTSLAEWSLFVGQAGHPIAHVYYCARRDLCVYAPPSQLTMEIAACKRDVAAAIQDGRLPHNPAVARYAVGLTSSLPAGLGQKEQRIATQLHDRCFPLLHRKP